MVGDVLDIIMTIESVAFMDLLTFFLGKSQPGFTHCACLFEVGFFLFSRCSGKRGRRRGTAPHRARPTQRTEASCRLGEGDKGLSEDGKGRNENHRWLSGWSNSIPPLDTQIQGSLYNTKFCGQQKETRNAAGTISLHDIAFFSMRWC